MFSFFKRRKIVPSVIESPINNRSDQEIQRIKNAVRKMFDEQRKGMYYRSLVAHEAICNQLNCIGCFVPSPDKIVSQIYEIPYSCRRFIEEDDYESNELSKIVNETDLLGY